jgi:hypothetical protein
MKTLRYYEIIEGMAYVYEAPYSSLALSVSVVPVSDLTYYRNNFQLSKIWGIKP